MVATISASASSKNSLGLRRRSARLALAEHRHAGHEVLHDGAEDGRLQVLPLAVALGDGDEVAAEENAGDAGDGEQAFRPAASDRAAPRGRGNRRCPRRGHIRPGRNFRVAGFGVASVWMNIGSIARLRKSRFVWNEGR